MYVIVYWDVEGIQRIFWAGESAEEAKRIALELRSKCQEYYEKHLKPYEGNWGAKIPKEVWDSPWCLGFGFDPGRICVMAPSEKKEYDYECCCGKLGLDMGEVYLI